MRLDAIIIGERFRKDMGDIKGLAESITTHGLLHPIVVKKDRTLVAGHRRIEAFRMLKLEEIPATVIEVEDLLAAERDENAERKDFTPSEAVAIGRLIEECHRVVAVQAKRENMARTQAIRMGVVSGESPHIKRVGETREVASRAVGMSAFTYQRAKNVIAAAEVNPEQFGDLPAQMDETGNVLGAHRELERRKSNGTTGRHPIHKKTHHANHTKDMERAVWALQGAVKTIADVDVSETDDSKHPEWIESLTETRAALSVVLKKLKGNA